MLLTFFVCLTFFLLQFMNYVEDYQLSSLFCSIFFYYTISVILLLFFFSLFTLQNRQGNHAPKDENLLASSLFTDCNWSLKLSHSQFGQVNEMSVWNMELQPKNTKNGGSLNYGCIRKTITSPSPHKMLRGFLFQVFELTLKGLGALFPHVGTIPDGWDLGAKNYPTFTWFLSGKKIS